MLCQANCVRNDSIIICLIRFYRWPNRFFPFGELFNADRFEVAKEDIIDFYGSKTAQKCKQSCDTKKFDITLNQVIKIESEQHHVAPALNDCYGIQGTAEFSCSIFIDFTLFTDWMALKYKKTAELSGNWMGNH